MAAVLLAAAIVGSLAVVLWTLLPLRRHATPIEAIDPRFVAQLAEREAALAELRDLDADHADGRLGEDDWQSLRTLAVERVARVLAALDGLGAVHTAGIDAAVRWLDGAPDGGRG